MLSFWNFTLFLSSLLTRRLMKLLSLFRIEREMMMITFATEISLLNFHYSTYVSHIHTHSRLNMYRKINILIVFISQLTAALMILDSLLFFIEMFYFHSQQLFLQFFVFFICRVYKSPYCYVRCRDGVTIFVVGHSTYILQHFVGSIKIAQYCLSKVSRSRIIFYIFDFFF